MNNEEKILAILTQMQGDISDLKTDVSGLKNGQAKLEADVSSLKTDVSGLKNGQAKLEADISSLKTDVSGLKNGQAKLEADISSLKTDVSSLKTDVSTIKVRIDMDIQKQLNLLAEGQKTILETLAPKDRVELLEDEVGFMKSVIKALAQRVSELEKAQ